MSREFKVQRKVDCHDDGVHCGDCRYCGTDLYDTCQLFWEGINYHYGNGYLRCQACLDAEKEQP